MKTKTELSKLILSSKSVSSIDLSNEMKDSVNQKSLDKFTRELERTYKSSKSLTVIAVKQ